MAEANLAQSRRQAEQTLVLAEADSQQAILAGRGEAQRIMQVGLSEAAVLMQKVAATAIRGSSPLSHVGSQLAKSTQPLVPERVFFSGSLGGDGTLARSASEGNGDGPSNGHVAPMPRRSPPPASSACCCKHSSPSGPALPMAKAPSWPRSRN